MPNVTVIANAHFPGGGEMSTIQICRQLRDRGDTLTFHPTGQISPRLSFPPDVRIGRPYQTVQPQRSDLLVFVANDHIHGLARPDHPLLRWARLADRAVCVLNFSIGQVLSRPYAGVWDLCCCLNGQMAARIRQTDPSVRIAVRPPCVDLSPFLPICPDYSRISLVRHSKVMKYPSDGAGQLSRLIRAHRAVPSAPPLSLTFQTAPPSFSQLIGPYLSVPLFSQPVADLLAAGSLFWYALPPRLRDQGPRAVVEAMAAGLPCMVDDRDGCADRVTPQTGWLCRTAADWELAFQEILERPELLAQKGRAAKERARTAFDPSGWADTLWGRTERLGAGIVPCAK